MKKFLSFSRQITWLYGEKDGKRNTRPKKQKRYHVAYQLGFNVLMKRYGLF